MKKIGVLFSGCGVFDGVEIQEAVITLLVLDRNGAGAVCMAPDIDQYHVVNHLNEQVSSETRNVLVESARITRGEMKNLSFVSSASLDGLIIPGGFGVAKNLSNFAFKGKNADVHPEVVRLVREMASEKKPIGAICISPAILTRILEENHPEVTIGNDLGTIDAIEEMGGVHQICAVDQIHRDAANNLFTTPAYMLGPGIKDVAAGIEKLVAAVVAAA